MQLHTPHPHLRKEGDFPAGVNPGYGAPFGTITLSEDDWPRFELGALSEDDCDRLIRAAAKVKTELIAQRALAAAEHEPRTYEGTCQHCGLPEDDDMHVTGPYANAIRAARHFAREAEAAPPAVRQPAPAAGDWKLDAYRLTPAGEAAADELRGFRWTGPDGLMHGCTRDDGHPADERGHEAYTADGQRITPEPAQVPA